jgi:hypothetical protein
MSLSVWAPLRGSRRAGCKSGETGVKELARQADVALRRDAAGNCFDVMIVLNARVLDLREMQERGGEKWFVADQQWASSFGARCCSRPGFRREMVGASAIAERLRRKARSFAVAGGKAWVPMLEACVTTLGGAITRPFLSQYSAQDKCK